MKRLTMLTNLLKILISIAGVLMLIGWLVTPNAWFKPLSYLATIVLPYVPDFFKLAKVKFSPSLIFAYELFIVIAMVLGIDLNWYDQILVTANGDSYYDKIVHLSSGILAAAAGQEVFSFYVSQSKSLKSVRWFQALFLISCVALVAVGWECFEFLYDQLCGGHMQELVKSGVSDTMWDMISSLVGGIIYISWLIQMQKPRISKSNSAK